ncbi:MAG: hypothetical protein U1E17_04190 [Geminicoccaceae bacterium]
MLVLYDGAVVRELAGEGITEQALVSSALNIDLATWQGRPHDGLALPADRAPQHALALPMFLAMFAIYVAN